MVVHCDLLHEKFYTVKFDISALPCLTIVVRQCCSHTESIAYYLFILWWITRNVPQTLVKPYLENNEIFFFTFFLRCGCWKYLYYFSYHWHSNFYKAAYHLANIFKHVHPAPSVTYIENKAAIASVQSS